jgi:hypothetical protein
MKPITQFNKVIGVRLLLLLLTCAGVFTAVLALFANSTVWLVVGLITAPLFLIRAFLTRGQCSSCNAFLVDAEKTLCSSCQHTLERHLKCFPEQMEAHRWSVKRTAIGLPGPVLIHPKPLRLAILDWLNRPYPVVEPTVERNDQDHDEKKIGCDRDQKLWVKKKAITAGIPAATTVAANIAMKDAAVKTTLNRFPQPGQVWSPKRDFKYLPQVRGISWAQCGQVIADRMNQSGGQDKPRLYQCKHPAHHPERMEAIF